MRLLAALFALCVTFCCVSERASSEREKNDVTTISIDARAAQQDPRLSKPVSLSARKMPLKQVLDQIQAQTGVAISIDERDPASGYPVLLQCDKTPAARIMNALFGVFSIRRGEWEWVRSGDLGAYRYSFHETPWAKNRGETYGRILDGILTNLFAVLRDMAPMKMQERKLHRGALKKVLFIDDDAMISGLFDNADSEFFWSEASFFFGALSPGQQESVLKGSPISVNLKSLPPEVYDLYHREYIALQLAHTDPSGVTTLVPEPADVQFFRSEPNFSADQLAPMIMLKAGAGAQSWTVTGHLDFGIREAIKHAWVLQGDNSIDAAARTVVTDSTDTEDTRKDKEIADGNVAQFERLIGSHMPAEARDRTLVNMRSGLNLEARLEQLARGGSVPVVAVLPLTSQNTSSNGKSFSTPVGKPVQEFLDHLEGSLKHHMYKWRDGVLLVNYPAWFIKSDAAISYSLLKALHADKTGQAPLRDWTALMGNVSDDQADWLAATYNYSGNMKQLRQMMLLIDHYPRVLETAGSSVDFDTLNNLAAASLLRPSDPKSGEHIRIRIRIDDPKLYAASALHFEWRDDESVKWFTVNNVPLPTYTEVLSKKPVAP